MNRCKDCTFFNLIPDNADDFEPDKGDCVTEAKDEKGKYWLSKPVTMDSKGCTKFKLIISKIA